MASRLEDPEHVTSVCEELGEHPPEILSSAKRHYEAILRIYHFRHGFMVQFLSLFVFMAHADLKAGVPESQLQALHSNMLLAIIGLRNQSHPHYTGRMVFSAVRGAMRIKEAVRMN
jgi:hypothetical protein